MGARVSYNDAIIHEAASGETFTLNTEDKYMSSDIVVEVDQSGGSLQTKTITENGTYNPDTGYDGFSQVTANVPNTYTSSDEGKVVDNGALVAQGSLTITENDTYDTTLVSELIANISGGGGGAKNILGGTTAPTSADGTDGDIYIQYTDRANIPDYTVLEWLGVESAGAYIDTGIANSSNAYFEVDAQWTDNASVTNNNAIFGAQTSYEFAVNSWNNTAFIAAGGSHATVSTPKNRHKYTANASALYIDDNVTSATTNWNAATNRNYYLFANNYRDGVLKGSNIKVYSCKIYDGSTLVRDYLPVRRDSDNELGMYDLVSDSFFSNDGTGTFVAGSPSSAEGTPINTCYLKVNDSWIILEDGEWDDVNTGGSSGDAQVDVGTFVTASTQYGIVDVDCGFKPDLVMITLPFSNADTTAYWWEEASWAETNSIWALKPAENNIYTPALGRQSGETGIQAINDDGFSFMSNAANTRGVTCNYVAVKYGE